MANIKPVSFNLHALLVKLDSIVQIPLWRAQCVVLASFKEVQVSPAARHVIQRMRPAAARVRQDSTVMLRAVVAARCAQQASTKSLQASPTAWIAMLALSPTLWGLMEPPVARCVHRGSTVASRLRRAQYAVQDR